MSNRSFHANKEENIKIQNELEKHNWKYLYEFSKIFPCPNGEILEILIPDKSGNSYYDDVFYLEFDSYNSFWTNWNKYKKLKVFL